MRSRLLGAWFVCIGVGFALLGFRATIYHVPWWGLALRWVIAAGFIVLGLNELRRARR